MVGRNITRELRSVNAPRACGGPPKREASRRRAPTGGLRNKEIAAKLAITEGTVKLHLHHIYRKLGIQSRVELALCAKSRDWARR